jgi:diguanylate cyclase (GGDEF)-like protein
VATRRRTPAPPPAATAPRAAPPATAPQADGSLLAEALGAENAALREKLAQLKAEALRNTALLAKTHDLELRLLRTATLEELVRELVEGLRAAYQLDAVTLLLDDPQHEIRHLLGDGLDTELVARVRHVDGLDRFAAALGRLERPWLGSRLPGEVVRALNPAGAGGSYAVMPMPAAERRLGLLVFESRDPHRFEPAMASDFLGHLGAVAAVCLENAANRARLLRTGVTDFLTGFHNRRYLHARMREELARAQRVSGRVGLLMIDVDHFKSINDRHGHLGGDAVLREIAQRIARTIRTSDTGARFGGDEFAVLVAGAGGPDLDRLATRIAESLAASPVTVPGGAGVRVTLSLGGAVAEPGPTERDYRLLAERLTAEADAALYRAKSAGRARHVIADRCVR